MKRARPRPKSRVARCNELIVQRVTENGMTMAAVARRFRNTDTFLLFSSSTGIGLGPSLSLDLTFVPDARCDVESFGDPCGGVTMTALPTNLGVSYTADGLDPNGLGIIAFGASLPAASVLPFAPGCDQLVGLGLTQLHFADGSGRVTAFQSLSSPTLPPQFSISMQFGGLMANGQILTSNGIHLNCPPN